MSQLVMQIMFGRMLIHTVFIPYGFSTAKYKEFFILKQSFMQ